MRIAVIDYKAGNLRNVQKAVESLGTSADIISKPEELSSYGGIILPGVGSFRDGMDSLNSSGLVGAIKSEAMDSQKPLMGICLGMHLLAEEGDEGGFTKGLGLLPMKVVLFTLENNEERLPHMGWNNIIPNEESLLFKDIPKDSDFYFAHSYHVVLKDQKISAAQCKYSYKFVAAVERKNIFATQFHPEKSQRFGFLVLNNFLNYCKKTEDNKGVKG